MPELTKDEMKVKAEKVGVPEHLVDGLVSYVHDRRPTGSFLECVLSNDLKGAIERGDDESIWGLKKIVVFLYTYAPGTCWGSPAKVTAWLRRG